MTNYGAIWNGATVAYSTDYNNHEWSEEKRTTWSYQQSMSWRKVITWR